jgi:nucleolin
MGKEDKKDKKLKRSKDEAEGEKEEKKEKKEKKDKKDKKEKEVPEDAPAKKMKMADDDDDDVKIHPKSAAGGAAGGSITVFVSNLPFSIDDDAIKGVFKDCGEITTIKWLSDRETGRFKGCGFLEFDSVESANKAIGKNGEDLQDRPMKVTTAETKAPREKTPGKGFDQPQEAGAPNLEVYVGNLSYNIDDDSIKAALKACGTITNIRWITDRDSGEFKGAGFISFSSLEESAKAIAMHGQDVLGRPLKVSYAKGRPERPAGAAGAGGKKFENKLSEKPEGCTKIFCGNLPFDIDDDKMKAFFADCGTVTAIRWLTDKVTGDFKGVGFVDFDSEAAVALAVKKAGEQCYTRPIRIDYAN